MSRVGEFGRISEINDHLFLSGAGVLKPTLLKQIKITCIVNATMDEPNHYIEGIDYVKVRVDDHPFAHLDNYFDLVADKIKSTRERGGRTLVHCVAGVSRSAALCMVYLMKHIKLSLRQAYYHVKSSRSIIHPNPGFWKQMIDYELRLTGKKSVYLVPARSEGDSVPDVYLDEKKRALPFLNGSSGFRSSSHPPSHLSARLPSSYSSYYSTAPATSSSSSSAARRASSGSSYAPPSYRFRRSPSPATTSWSARHSRSYGGGGGLNGMSRNGGVRGGGSKTKGNIFSSLYETHQSILFPSL